MKTLIIIEDSSRVNFGGGQKMTLLTTDILTDLFDFRFVDFTNNSRFVEKLEEDYSDCSFVFLTGHGARTTNRLISWLTSIICFFIYIFSDLESIVDGIDKNNSIVYATNKRALLYACMLKWRYKIPFIYHDHLVESQNFIIKSILSKLLKMAEVVICVSNTVKNSISVQNSIMIYNPSLNDRGYKGDKTDNHFVVASVGGLIPIKGVEYFIEASNLVDSNIEFRIYGEGPLLDVLKEKADGRVKFMGFVKDIIDEEYKDIDIVVVTTVIPESLSLAAVDAKSAGIPLIVTKPGGQAEIVSDGINGYHVPIKDGTAIAERISLLTENLNFYNKMARASYESFSSFGYRTYKEKIIGIFRKHA